MAIRSLGNSSVRYNAVMSKTGNGGSHFPTIGSKGAGAATRGVFGGAYPQENRIDYITVASAGNASDFGDLTRSVQQAGALASDTRGLWGGGHVSGESNVIDYVTIASAGNATDFGLSLIEK